MLAVGIGKQAFLAAAARHDALACAENVDGLRIHEAVLVKWRDRHIIKPRRDDLHFKRIEAVAQNRLEIAARHRLVSARLDELVEEFQEVVPDLPMFRGRGQALIVLARLRPGRQLCRDFERFEQAVNRRRVIADSLALGEFCRIRERPCGLAAQVVDFDQRFGVVLRQLFFRIVKRAAAMPWPRLFHRPALRTAHAEFEHIVFELVNLLARQRKKARAQRADDGLIAPAAHGLER